MAAATKQQIVDLNVGGVLYTTSLETLTKDPVSLLCEMFQLDQSKLLLDSKGRVFIDRDGVLFRYVLDFLRNQVLILPENFQERSRLQAEAAYFRLFSLVEQLNTNHKDGSSKDPGLLDPGRPVGSCTHMETTQFRKRPSATDMSGASGGEGYIVLGYRGTFTFGRDMSDVKFRKLTRILVHGKVMLCREVFQDTLNDSRDPDRGMDQDRYTARYYLKHTQLEQAFDQLSEAGFRLVGSCGTGTSSPTAPQDLKPGQCSEESQWNHYNEFVFVRETRHPEGLPFHPPAPPVDA